MNQLLFSSARPFGSSARLLALSSVAAAVQRARARPRKAAESPPPAASSGTAAKAAVPAAAAPRKRPVHAASSPAAKQRKLLRKAAESPPPAASSAAAKARKQRRKAADGKSDVKGLSSLGQEDKYLLLREVANMPPTAACDYVGLLGDQMGEDVWQLHQLPPEKLRKMRDELRPRRDCRPDPLPGKIEYLWLCYDPSQQSHPPTPGREPLEIDEENDNIIIGFATRPRPRQEQRKLRAFRDEFAAKPDSRDHKELLLTVRACLENANARKMAGKEPEVFWPLGGGRNFPLGDGDQLWARSIGHWYCVIDLYMNAIYALGGTPKSSYRNRLRKELGGELPLMGLLGVRPFVDGGTVYALRALKKVSWYALTAHCNKLKGVFLVGGAHHCVCVDRTRRLILNAASHFEMALTQQNLIACGVLDGPIQVVRVTAVQPIEVL